MDLYTTVAYDLSRHLTLRYSTSFGLASRLYTRSLRPHIYAIYGMVRVADEIVDTYQGEDRARLLQAFAAEAKAATDSGYSTNPIVMAFAATARQFGITAGLIDPFFTSMRMDINKTSFTGEEYAAYIYGSAEVIGLMCLRVFCAHRPADYDELADGARLLGSAYQKINFLRDFAADYRERGRVYFPGMTFEAFDDGAKNAIVTEITTGLHDAAQSIDRLPPSARRAVHVSYRYYGALLNRLGAMRACDIKEERAHVSSAYKLAIFTAAAVGLV